MNFTDFLFKFFSLFPSYSLQAHEMQLKSVSSQMPPIAIPLENLTVAEALNQKPV